MHDISEDLGDNTLNEFGSLEGTMITNPGAQGISWGVVNIFADPTTTLFNIHFKFDIHHTGFPVHLI